MVSQDKVILVGGGHNGLVAAGYLAQAGLTVQVLERREMVGGAAVTEEWFPGYQVSSCSMVLHGLRRKVINDLELHKHGYHVDPIDPVMVNPLPNGKAVRIWLDQDKTVEEIRRISPHDADAYIDWMEFWTKADRIVGDFALTVPPTLSQLAEKAKSLGAEDVLETLMMVPVKDLLERYFRSEEIRALNVPSLDRGDFLSPGGLMETAIFGQGGFRGENEDFGIVRGGMGSITRSMARSAEARGVSIRTNAEVKRILIEKGRVTGVELENGEVLTSDIVVSNADPKRTFLKLVDPADLEDDFLEEVKALKTDASSLKVHCALRELPDFSTYLGPEFDPKDLALMRICPPGEDVQSSWEDAMNGRVARTPVIMLNVPTVYDPTLAPPGHHVMSMWVYHEPAHLKEGSWADVREEVGEQLIDEVCKYAPNFRDALVDWAVFTPEDIEERVGLTDGNIRHLDMSLQQSLSRRPMPGWSDYRTPIQGLYLCGAGTHPGGEVTGAPGHNAAHVILEDCGVAGG